MAHDLTNNVARHRVNEEDNDEENQQRLGRVRQIRRQEDGRPVIDRLNIVNIRMPDQKAVEQVDPINEQELVHLNILKIDVLDGVTANRRLTREILGSGLIINDPENPNIYIIDQNLDEKLKGRLAHISKIVEDRMEKTLPKQIYTFQKPVIRANDCVIMNRDELINSRIPVTPIIDGIPVLVNKKRDSITFYKITEEGFKPLEVEEWFENIVYDIEDHVTFFCAFVGILIKVKQWYSKMILVDYINNGTSIGNLEYSDRYARLHELSSLLVSDAFSIMKLQWNADEITAGSAGPFFMVNMKHVNEGNAPLLVPAIIKNTNDMEPGTIIFGNEPFDDEVKDFDAVIIEPEREKLDTIENMTVCVTGRWKNGLTRDGVKKLIEDNGGIWTRYVNSKTKLLVIANNPGERKRENAERLGVTIIKMDELLKIIDK